MREHVNRKCYFLLLASIFLTPRNFGIFFLQGRSSDFVPTADSFPFYPFVGRKQWIIMSEVHKGTHSCGTVGDFHSHSLLIAVMRTL